MRCPWLRRVSSLLLTAVVILVITGCASTPKVDWGSRVGNYSYDQAVRELGPPDKTAELTDGTMVADWNVRQPGQPNVNVGLGVETYRAGSGVSVGQSVGTTPPELGLRLTFDKDRKLIRWSGQ